MIHNNYYIATDGEYAGKIVEKNSLGEENYYTELAKRGRAICEFSCSRGRKGREELLHFVDRIESGEFEEQENPEQLQIFCAWQEKASLNQTGSGWFQYIPLFLFMQMEYRNMLL